MSHTFEQDLTNRVAVVTGGARGLGYAMAQALAGHGAAVVLLDRLDAVVDSAAALAAETGVQTAGITVDVTDEASVVAAFDAIGERFGTADVLINAAGITLDSPAIETSVEAWNRLMGVNLTGTFIVNREFARRYTAAHPAEPAAALATTHKASIINVSSMSAFAVNIPQTQAAYNTSKAAVSMLTKSFAVEWLPLGIRVNAIAPGYFASDMTRDFVAENPEMAADWVSRIPAGRMGQPEELGDLIVYLAGDRSDYVVGQSIVIDGGYTIV
ncbi:SDR family NAD(P)-dependent oxidoreductase [Microbacterium sp. NPDC056234]|uniref:SDR family NAD(P)-dependent oxidoreductase n=1 Tax=Microbacterium sp. NPDC056234 TaxID=3345757 RepID=UPI0035E23A2F